MVVYPRWRGELFCALAFCWLSRGLSPLARGTLCRCQHCWRVIRFIPAGAGNTCCRRTRRALPPVYPRWRGEHLINLISAVIIPGLSPLARGTRLNDVASAMATRFIPAGAGNTITFIASEVQPPVYPRWRGEHVTMLQPVSDNIGLSPLARGTLCSPRRAMKRIRFIPAGAGNTLNITYY